MLSLQQWIYSKLNYVADQERVLVRDPLGMLNEADSLIDSFATEKGFTVVRASTNLAFRNHFEMILKDPDIQKIMVIDQTPMLRIQQRNLNSAPPLFYPDFIYRVTEEARIDLDLRQYLRETTGDDSWPLSCNEHRYARLIVPHINEVIRAYQNLRKIERTRFTDSDFETIVAFAALGMPEVAFKKLGPEEYWRIGLMEHDTLEELRIIAPHVVTPIEEEISKAPAPFCWFRDKDPEEVVSGFYLSTILAQHSEQWNLLMAYIDSGLASFEKVDVSVIQEAAPRLVGMDISKSERYLLRVEAMLDRDLLEFVLVKNLRIDKPEGFTSILIKERYSTLFRSLALLMALSNLLEDKPAFDQQKQINSVLFSPETGSSNTLVNKRHSRAWTALITAYQLVTELNHLRQKLAAALKMLAVKRPAQLGFGFFWRYWNQDGLNRVEYYLSALERQVNAGLLPRRRDELPEVFVEAYDHIQRRVSMLSDELRGKIDRLNQGYQDMVATHYPFWVQGSPAEGTNGTRPVLSSQFIGRCLKPYWDPENEKAVILIFDGMRYEIWDLFMRNMMTDYMEIIEELPGSALLPTETHISRKAICAGTFPDEFDSRSAENKLLEQGLKDYFGMPLQVEAIVPDGLGTGETVHYRAGNLEVYIFELCDTELHKIKIKKLDDKREVPGRPLAFIYEQHIKNIIDNEVMSILQSISPDTKVFITADHGFARVGRRAIWFETSDLNEAKDCSYLNCFLRSGLKDIDLPTDVRKNIIVFTPSQLRVPAGETIFNRNTGMEVNKQYRTVAFPRVGYSFKRKGSPYNPDAYSHGGISLEEMMIPMIILKVRSQDQGLLSLGPLSGPMEVVEGEMIEFKMRISRRPGGVLFADELRVDVDARYAADTEQFSLPHQVIYLGGGDETITFNFRPDVGDASDTERRKGLMQRVLTVEVSYKDGQRTVRKTRSREFTVKLNSERIIRRVPPRLGNILGVAPKNMR